MRMLFWTYVAVCFLMAPFVLAEERDIFARIPHFTAQTWMGMRSSPSSTTFCRWSSS
jgi:hypothetical protein